ncbi:hypothetical protein [Vibrio sinaloensis]|uniref:hypothetical protein n=1 Tax=Photobacterium sp. (strain ATCC 43367) TaxID=379097 RepID=UPI002062C7D7|nr:hypothetical protein [Vibrio sinaloensis]UPQ89903.1 hypothetical protein MTO69_14130 [Vibrio sinaloensis]
MTNQQPMSLFSVSDWRSYHLVRAISPQDALKQAFGDKLFQIIDNSELNDDTVVHAMCCEYKAEVESALESLYRDLDRVLWLDAYPNTLRYQVTY